jgi:hypothetical protein
LETLGYIVQLKPQATEDDVVSPIKNYSITCLLFVISINANIQKKLKPGASSPGAKQYGQSNRQSNMGTTNQPTDQPTNQRTDEVSYRGAYLQLKTNFHC